MLFTHFIITALEFHFISEISSASSTGPDIKGSFLPPENVTKAIANIITILSLFSRFGRKTPPEGPRDTPRSALEDFWETVELPFM